MSGTYRENEPHLWKRVPKGRRGSTTKVQSEHEGRCTVCGARVTVDPSDGTEYGHGYGCPHLPDEFSRPSPGPQKIDLSEHICPVCGRGNFETDHSMRSHLGSVHDHVCQKCDTEHPTERDLNVHKVRDHTNAAEVFECPTCPAAFGERRRMRDHHVKAHDERIVDEIECANCGDPIKEPRERDNQRYCSIKCTGEDQAIEPVEARCVICDDPYRVSPAKAKKRATCGSDSCQSEHNRRRLCETCVECGSEYKNAYNTQGCKRCWDCRSDDELPEVIRSPPHAKERGSGGVAGD